MHSYLPKGQTNSFSKLKHSSSTIPQRTKSAASNTQSSKMSSHQAKGGNSPTKHQGQPNWTSSGGMGRKGGGKIGGL